MGGRGREGKRIKWREEREKWREEGGEEREDWRDGYRVTLNMASQLWSLLAAIFFSALPL